MRRSVRGCSAACLRYTDEANEVPAQQWLLASASVERLGNFCGECLEVEIRLHQVAVGAAVGRPFDVGRLLEIGQHDDGYVPGSWIAFEAAKYVEAMNFRH